MKTSDIYLQIWFKWFLGFIDTLDVYKEVKKILRKYKVDNGCYLLYKDPRWWYDVTTLVVDGEPTEEELAWIKLFAVAQIQSDRVSQSVKKTIKSALIPMIIIQERYHEIERSANA